MENAEIYESILSKIATELAHFGFQRSGKSALFYRYSHDKRIACALQMQKSMFNGPEGLSFTFNFVCVCVKELRNYSKGQLTLAAVKTALGDFRIFERIGPLCRGKDYWWSITDDILKNISPDEYYDRFLKKDILQTVQHLDIRAEIKAKMYL